MAPVRRGHQTKPRRHNPLQVDVERSAAAKRPRQHREDIPGDEEDILGATRASLLPAALSRKILEAAKEQLDEYDVSSDDEEEQPMVHVGAAEESIVIDQEIDEDEECDLTPFLAAGRECGVGGTIADTILEKLKQRQSQTAEGRTASEQVRGSEMPPKAVEVYKTVGGFMSRFRSGKLPKPFTIIPRLSNWEEVLYYTEPDKWSPSALKEVTKLFASNLNPKMAQRYYNLVLLPAFRDDVAANKKVNPHIFDALKKAIFKPDAWFKGLLLPLAQDDCTYLEAVILGGILKRVSVPMLHAAAALARLSQMFPWYGTTSLLMTSLIDKKFALPGPVVDMLVDHFYSFVDDKRTLPLVWHRCLLTFAQRYKDALDDGQKSKIKDLLRIHRHHAVAPEILREMFDNVPTVGWITAQTSGADEDVPMR